MVNKMWHQKNRMPAKATLAQRVKWHREHQQHCACRDIPKSIKKHLERERKVPHGRINASNA